MKDLNMVYWFEEDMWVGKFLEYPKLMTQGETLEELEENLRDLFQEMILYNVPQQYQIKELRV